MLSVCHRVTNNLCELKSSQQESAKMTHIFEEDFENTAGLFVDETRNTFHTATTRETADSGLGDTLDVVPKNLPVALCSALSKSLSTLHRASSETVHTNDAFQRLTFPRPDIVGRVFKNVGSGELRVVV